MENIAPVLVQPVKFKPQQEVDQIDDYFIPTEIEPIGVKGERIQGSVSTLHKSGKKEYTIEEKIATLVCLKENNYNLSKTSQVTGVQPLTIKQWRRDHGKELDNLARETYFSEIALLSDHLEEKSKESKDKFLKATHIVKMVTLNRMAEIIPEERNLRFLSDTLKILHEITDGNTPTEETKKTTNQFLQMVQNQIITIKENTDGDQTS